MNPDDYNTIDGEICCWRCGMSKNSQEIKDGVKCNVWGKTYKQHLWKAKPVGENPLANEDNLK